MNAGNLRHKIVIQTPTTTKTSGVSTTTWATFHDNIFASIEQLKGFNRANAQAVWPGADYTISIRYIPGILGNMRIIDENGTIFSILGTPNDVDGRHREITMTCESNVKAN